MKNFLSVLLNLTKWINFETSQFSSLPNSSIQLNHVGPKSTSINLFDSSKYNLDDR
jgi:hypothetical protein